MGTKYHAFGGSMDDLESFLLQHQDILDRCSFDTSWQWIWNGKGCDQIYVSAFTVHLSDESDINEHSINSNKNFFYTYSVQRYIGAWSGELFHAICKIVDDNDMEFGSSMGIENGCYALHKYMKKDSAHKLAELINTTLGYKTRVQAVGRGDYIIHMHSDQSVLDNLDIKEIEPTKKTKQPKNKSELLSEEQRLLKELAEVRKKMKKKC